MEYVVSNDGTRIALEREGEGPPLVLIHGTGIDHSYWDPVAPELGRHFAVYSVDRRGRGQSGDTAPYAIQREFEDVAAIVGSIAGDVFLVGHSYGALCSLEAALLTANVGKMILNEPPMYTTVEVSFPADARARILSYVGAGEWERALVLLYEAGGMPAAELHLLRSLPSWHARIQAAPTILREIISVRGYSFDPARFKHLRTPVLLLVGGETSPVYTAAAETLQASLPNSRLVVLPGQPHDATLTAPELFLEQVLRFLPG
jgi:pimeloyl-ACP methyl ester carboxylesterase